MKTSNLYYLIISFVFLLIISCAQTMRQTMQGETAFMRIVTQPANAEIYLDDELLGKTPVDLAIELPDYTHMWTYNEFTVTTSNHRYIGKENYELAEKKTHILRINKEGFKSVEFKFSFTNLHDSIPDTIHLEQEIAEGVSITGAAGMLARMTIGGPNEKMCSLSPDKRWMLVELHEVGKDASKNAVLAKVDLVYGGRIILTPTGSDNKQGEWLPDMSGIVFVSNRMGDYTLAQSLGVSGEVGIRFISPIGLNNVETPRVSPGGDNIAFVTYLPGQAVQLASIYKDGTNLKIFGSGRMPSWANKDKTLAFSRKVGDRWNIYTMDFETGANLTEVTLGNSNDFWPSWSPDDKWIAFASDRVADRYHLFIVRPNGLQVTQLTDGLFDISNVYWASDGFIYFTSNAGYNLDIWRLKPKTD